MNTFNKIITTFTLLSFLFTVSALTAREERGRPHQEPTQQQHPQQYQQQQPQHTQTIQQTDSQHHPAAQGYKAGENAASSATGGAVYIVPDQDQQTYPPPGQPINPTQPPPQ